MDRPGGDDTPFVYSGTLVVQGQGIAVVRSTGAGTEMGRIGKALAVLEVERTPAAARDGRLVRLFALIGLSLCTLVVLVLGLTRGDWIEGLLAGLTLGMAMLPEEFPVVLTIFLALGAWRLSRHNVLTRRIPAVETLGATTALCVDKTGTLTLNRMSVAELAVGEEIQEIDAQGHLAARSLPRGRGVRHAGQPRRPLRPHGEGDEGARRTHARRDRAPAPRLGVPA